MFLKEPTMKEYFLITWCIIIPLMGLAGALLWMWIVDKDDPIEEDQEDGEI